MRISIISIFIIFLISIFIISRPADYYQLRFYDENNHEITFNKDVKNLKDYLIENNIYFQIQKESEFISPISKIRNYVISRKIGDYPWSKNLDDKHREDYLYPMRIGLERSQDWKMQLNDRYRYILDSFDNIGCTSRREVSLSVLNDLNSWFKYDEDIIFTRYPSFEQLSYLKKGDCYTISYISVMALRASGIPSALDFCPFWSNKIGGHTEFVFLNDSNVFESNVNTKHKHGLKDAPKVYRLSSKENVAYKFLTNTDIHSDLKFLADLCYEDVTMQHANVTNKKIPLNNQQLNGQLIYACVYSGGKWHPVAVSLAKSSCAIFENLNKNINYKFAYQKNGTLYQIL
ncbi:hypothetical protein [Sphingobacterium sp.]|uniref:hypothetical protein n=1 Tax=Sphingobacterium sp. TaxID=341027 RepID=UPI002586ECE5|nr:hypothetical protein [Sphingobacterium sp.]WET68801.1 MAG: hypothetical protein P0Y57_23470 [Sphingobacterium sp.]